MKIVLSGGTGFIGQPLIEKLLEQEHQVVLLTRSPERQQPIPNLTVERWEARGAGPWAAQLDGADAVINLAGEPIANKRWTAVQKDRLLRSRIDATEALVNAIQSATQKPSVLINASAVGYYGDVPEGEVTSPNDGYLCSRM